MEIVKKRKIFYTNSICLKNSYFDKIPIEILLLIFQYLENKELLIISLTCKRWREIIFRTPSWDNLTVHFTKFEDPIKVFKFYESRELFRKISFTWLPPIEKLPKFSQNLKTIIFHNDNDLIPGRDIFHANKIGFLSPISPNTLKNLFNIFPFVERGYFLYKTEFGCPVVIRFGFRKHSWGKFVFPSQRVLTPKGEATIVGDGTYLWFHLDGKDSATFWDTIIDQNDLLGSGFKILESNIPESVIETNNNVQKLL